MKQELVENFQISYTLYGTLSAFYLYAYVPMQLIVGFLVDRFNMRYLLSSAVLFCSIGTFLVPLTNEFWVAATGRFLQGFGSAFAFVGLLKLGSVCLPKDRFATFSAAATALGFIGAAFGEFIINKMVANLGWERSLNELAVIGLFLCAVMYFILKLNPRSHKMAVFRAIPSQEIKTSFKDILTNKLIWFSGVLSFLIYLPTTVFADLWGVSYLESTKGYNKEQAALAIAMIYIGWAIGQPLFGHLSDRMHVRVSLMRYGSFVAFFLSLILLYLQLPYVLTCVLFAAFGIASGCQFLTFVLAKDVASHKTTGTAIAFVNTLAMLSGLIFQSVVGWVLDRNSSALGESSGAHLASSYYVAMMIIPIGIGIAFLMTFFVKEKKGQYSASAT